MNRAPRTCGIAATLVVAPLLLSCDGGPAAPSEPGWLTAEVQGDRALEFQGSGSYTVAFGSMGSVGTRLAIRSIGRDDAVHHQVMILVGAHGPPPVGSYTIAPFDPTLRTASFTAAFHAATGPETGCGWVSDGGEIEITRRYVDAFEGSFRFTAVRSTGCHSSAPGSISCAFDRAVDPESRIEVTGSFRAREAVQGPIQF
jgi:hypothetical protein